MVSLRFLTKKRYGLLIVGLFSTVVIFGVIVSIHSQRFELMNFGQVLIGQDNVTGSQSSSGIEFEEDFLHKLEDNDINTSIQQDFISSALSHVGNLPDQDFILAKSRVKSLQCGNFPDLFRIEFSNLHWQVQSIGNLTFYLFRAYYDKRTSTKPKGPSVRILVIAEEPNSIQVGVVCQLWYRNKVKSVTSPMGPQLQIWSTAWTTTNARYTAHILTCPLPVDVVHGDIEQVLPVSVSLVGNACDNATNNLVIMNEVSDFKVVVDQDRDKRKRRFGVCVKGLDFLRNDQSLRLIEWIELLLIQGVDKIFFYEFSVHPNVKKVLEYYKTRGKVDVTPLTLPGTLPNESDLRRLFLSNYMHTDNKRKNEVVPLNDCLFRNLNQFDYLGVLDTDEVIIPKSGNTWEWKDLITEIDETLSHLNTTKKPSSYCFRNVYFFDSIPPEGEELTEAIPSYLHMLKHIFRAGNYTPPGRFVKCIHSTANTLLVHNHFPLKCIDGNCNIHEVDVNIAHMQHYRSTCVKDLRNCDDYKMSPFEDSTIWKYKDALTNRVYIAISKIRLF